MSHLIAVLAAGSTFGDKAGDGLWASLQPLMIKLLIIYFICLGIGALGHKNVSRAAVIGGLVFAFAIPIVSPDGFQHMLKSWSDSVTSRF